MTHPNFHTKTGIYFFFYRLQLEISTWSLLRYLHSYFLSFPEAPDNQNQSDIPINIFFNLSIDCNMSNTHTFLLAVIC